MVAVAVVVGVGVGVAVAVGVVVAVGVAVGVVVAVAVVVGMTEDPKRSERKLEYKINPQGTVAYVDEKEAVAAAKETAECIDGLVKEKRSVEDEP